MTTRMQRVRFKSPSECAGLRIEGGGGFPRSGGAEDFKKKSRTFTATNPEHIFEIKKVGTNAAAEIKGFAVGQLGKDTVYLLYWYKRTILRYTNLRFAVEELGKNVYTK